MKTTAGQLAVSTSAGRGTCLLLFVGFYLAWLAPRFAAIVTNSPSPDDLYFFLVANYPLDTLYRGHLCGLPPQDYRWLSSALGCGFGLIFPSLGTSVVPKLLAGLWLAAFSTLLYRLLIRWSVPAVVALLVPLVFLLHPIVSEISLRNDTSFFSLWLMLCPGAYLLMEKERPLWQQSIGLVLLIMVVLAYEIYLVSFLVLILGEHVIKRGAGEPTVLSDSRRKVAAFAAVAMFYVVQVLLTKWIFGAPAGRGFVSVVSVSAYVFEKVHGVLNLAVNCYMPLVSYYLGPEVALKAWKWIPISISAATLAFGLLGRRSWREAFFLAGFSLVLPLVPTLPIFLMSQSPEAWRVSIPVLLAVCLTIGLLATLICNGVNRVQWPGLCVLHFSAKLALALLVAICVAEAPATFAEAGLQAFENRADRSLMQVVSDFWARRGLKQDQYRVGVIRNLGLSASIPAEHARAARMPAAYRPRGVSSNLDYDWSWRGLLKLYGFRVVELDNIEPTVVGGCDKRPEMCRLDLRDNLAKLCAEHPDFTQEAPGWRLVHDVDDGISAICR